MHVPLFDLEEHEADLDPSDTETESPLNYEAITNRKTLNQLYKLYWDSLETEQYDGCSPSFIFREAEKVSGRGRLHFLLSLLGYSFNLGNIWRFPYIVYNYGGGTFLIPFVLMLLVIGFPMLFMELALGQFSNFGPVTTYEKICPIFQGIGYSVIFLSVIMSVYYNIVVAWGVLYLVSSLTSLLPWKHCDPSWSSPDCCDSNVSHCLWKNVSSNHTTSLSNNSVIFSNLTFNLSAVNHITPSVDYFRNVILDISGKDQGIGKLNWPLVLSLLTVWCFVIMSMCRGMASSSKVACVTVPFSCFVLFTFFIRAVSLEGSASGVRLFLKPDFSELAKPEIWLDAAVQTFFTLGPVLGGIMSFTSYNMYHNDCFKDSLILLLTSSTVSFFTGLALFAGLGFMADKYGLSEATVAERGVGFVFAILSEVVLQLPFPSVWVFLVFAMFLMVGINSQIGLIGTTTSAVLEKISFFRGKLVLVVLLLCLSQFLLGIILCTQGGVFIVQFLDFYTARWAVLILALFQCLVIGWIYGSARFLRDTEIMIGPRGISWHWFFSLFWKFITPLSLMVLLIISLAQFEPLHFGSGSLPGWVHIIGGCLSLLPVVIILYLFVAKYISAAAHQMTHLERLKFCAASNLHRGHAPDIAAALNRISTDPQKTKNSFENPTYNVVYTFETNM